ncbi:MAG: LolA family protein [Jatrophihabitans sp.]
MNVPAIVHRHPALRWLAPIAVVGIAGLAATGTFDRAAASRQLPATSPAALIAAVQAPKVTGFSGTLVSRLSLGLPELPAIGNAGNGASLTSLLSGSHTLQFWYRGADKQRVALLGATDETDLFRSGRQVWQWSSADDVALHGVMPMAETSAAPTSVRPSPIDSLTPSGMATSVLAMLDPTTEMEIRNNRRVADRDAYELVLTPRTPATRVGSVHIAVDGRTKVPLGVQVYARGQSSAAVDVSFSTIRFAPPSDAYFRFHPPADAKVHDVDVDVDVDRYLPSALFGKTWSTVYTYRIGHPVAFRDHELGEASQTVSGTWGTGRLLTSDLFSVLVTNDGRVYTGAVDPDALYLAAGSK